MTWLVTGADGFIGRALCHELRARGLPLRAVTRRPGAQAGAVAIGPIEAFDRWAEPLRGVSCVVHLANLAHASSRDAAAARAVNVDATVRLARAAIDAGVPRFVFLSSAKVHGEETCAQPFTEAAPIVPGDLYAQLKAEAEAALLGLAAASSTRFTMLRPPLVYGPGVKANFLQLVSALGRGLPLPLAGLSNRRSLVFAGNLVDAVIRCGAAPRAAPAYLLCDGPPLSTPQLCRALGAALRRPARLFRLPQRLLELHPAMRKLTRSLVLDDSALRAGLGWRPLFSLEQGLAATAEWYRGR